MTDAKKVLEAAIQEGGPFNDSWLSGISRINAAWTADRERAEKAEQELAALRTAIFGGDNYAPTLGNGNFCEMAQTLHAAQAGALERAEKAEERVKVLEAVLEPFADEADRMEATYGFKAAGSNTSQHSIRLTDLRAARTAKEQS